MRILGAFQGQRQVQLARRNGGVNFTKKVRGTFMKIITPMGPQNATNCAAEKWVPDELQSSRRKNLQLHIGLPFEFSIPH